MTQLYAKPSHIENWIKQGKGQGIGGNYKPWFTARQVSSMGRTHNVSGIKTGREHLLLSDLEWYYFYLLEWSDVIQGFREQYPLLPIEETIDIAYQLGIDHPVEPRKKELKVMTTDFVIDKNDIPYAVVNIKPSNKITVREIEKMEIERLYWEKRQVEWSLVTEKDIPLTYAMNIRYVHKAHHLNLHHISSKQVMKAKLLMEPLLIKKSDKLTDITDFVDDTLGFSPGNCLVIVRHLIITKKWAVDMNVKIDPNRPLELLSINEKSLGNQGGIRHVY
ncbi:TnsA endonuclease N-terminal domain-containing protein [Paenibacillus polymyxa]|uniref:TnsA endonuclease N-terminal domain-containing protein n=1 Tax=Paenibacillus polymyxa TaxID=1406 RepID=UPI0020256496|nr:TnsA endonuclease N-terminal domain-containing protein [Paenibacillus polymyxa]WDZ55085.1 TnsA endonuclease N-terminal domain-containing protein [Paenibacillus polymyxa]